MYFKKEEGRKTPFVQVLLGKRFGTTSSEMVSFWSGFILFLEEQNFPIHNVEIKGIAPNHFTPSLIYLHHENSLQTFS